MVIEIISDQVPKLHALNHLWSMANHTVLHVAQRGFQPSRQCWL